jgi:nucleoid-associated protein YgaU
MSSLLDRLLGRDKKEPEKKETASKVSDEAAAKRREELARERKEAEEARKRFEQQEVLRKRKEAVEKAQAASKAKQAAEKLVATGTGAAADVKQVYVVKSGDSLSKIAKELLGDASRWPEIYELNKDVIGDNPNLIKPGQELKIPK